MSHGSYLQWAQERKELRAEIERLQAALDHDTMMHRDEIERLKYDNHRLMAWNEELQARCDAALAGKEGS